MNEFDDLTDLDDVLGPLRSDAQPAELVGERATVDLMVKAHRIPEEKHMFRSRSARIATLVAAGVLGFGGMAAASESISEFVASDEPVVEEPVVEEPVVEEPVVEEPVVEEPVVEEPVVEEPVVEEPVVEEPAAEEPVFENDPLTDFNEETCLVGNHGKTVSAVARGEFPADVTVKMAAQSSCGKIDQSVEVETEIAPATEGDSEITDEPKPKVKAERPGKGADKPDNGNGKSDGNGNGKSNGNGKRGG